MARLEPLLPQSRPQPGFQTVELLVVLRMLRFSLNHTRLPDGNDKRSLIRAIERTRLALPLRSVLRAIRLSPSRYHNWNRAAQCELADRPSCPQLSPHQLTAAEVEAIRELVTSDEYRHVPTGTLALFAHNESARSLLRRAHGTGWSAITVGGAPVSASTPPNRKSGSEPRVPTISGTLRQRSFGCSTGAGPTCTRWSTTSLAASWLGTSPRSLTYLQHLEILTCCC